MNTETLVPSRAPVTRRDGRFERLPTLLLSRLRRWRYAAGTRRRLLLIDERLLRDAGLEDDELLREARRRFRGIHRMPYNLPPESSGNVELKSER